MHPEHTQTLNNLFPKHLGVSGQQFFTPHFLPILLSIPATSKVILKNGLPNTLHPDEIEEYNSYSLTKRKEEFLTGRICAKLAITAFLQNQPQTDIPELRHIKIYNTPSGRPAFSLPAALHEKLNLDISISHSDQYGCALAAPVFCGIDIQSPSKTLVKVKDRYCTEEEEAIMCTAVGTKAASVNDLSKLWAAKEACKKALSIEKMAGFLDIVLQKTDPANPNIMHFAIKDAHIPHKRVVIATASFRNYGLALTLIC